MEPTNLIPKFTPVPIEVDEKTVSLIRETSERHSVPFGSMSVDAFHEGALIREAFAQYFKPDFFEEIVKWDDEGNEVGRESRDTVLSEMFSNVFPQGMHQSIRRWREDVGNYNFPVRVKILIDYPLQECWGAEVTVPADRFGSVFAIAHDMYAHIYKLDDAEWQNEGADEPPRAHPKMMNRARGKHVWGHDMSDLVFEYLTFTPNPEWPTISKKKMQILQVGDIKDLADAIKDPEKRKELKERLTGGSKLGGEITGAPAPLDYKEHAEEAPFLGWVTFSIGS